MALYLGIDGGGSKTDCAVGDERALLGRGSAGSSKLQRVGEERALAELKSAVEEACKAAGVTPAEISSTCIGIAGGARQEIAETLRRMLAGAVGGTIEVVGDMVIAHEAAFGDGPGVVVIAGTGSIAYGRNERGETARAGGWGPVVSDEGSGDWIGKQAVAAAMRAHDSGGNTYLTTTVMNTWHLATRDDLSRAANSYPPPNFAELLPQVIRAAEAGDTVARELLVRAGQELAKLARMVVRRLWPGPREIKVAMAGGVFRNAAMVRDSFRLSLAAERADAAVIENIVEPVLGALALARKGAGATTTG